MIFKQQKVLKKRKKQLYSVLSQSTVQTQAKFTICSMFLSQKHWKIHRRNLLVLQNCSLLSVAGSFGENSKCQESQGFLFPTNLHKKKKTNMSLFHRVFRNKKTQLTLTGHTKPTSATSRTNTAFWKSTWTNSARSLFFLPKKSSSVLPFCYDSRSLSSPPYMSASFLNLGPHSLK